MSTSLGLLIYIFLNFLAQLGLSLSYLKLNVQPNSGPVWLGDNVTFTCEPEGIIDKNLPLVFKRPTRILSEKCMIFEERYSLTCDPPKWENAKRFLLTIKNVAWSDRGNWLCTCSVNSSDHNLIVYAMGNVSSQAPELLDVGHPRMANPPGTQVETSRDDSQSLPHYRLVPQEGHGTQQSPYNLRPTAGKARFKISCKVSCSFPQTRLKWTASNSTMNVSLTGVPDNEVDFYSKCNQSSDTVGMAATVESVYINCSSFPLEGRSKITCEADGVQYEPWRIRSAAKTSQFSHSVYVVCPASSLDLQLTSGEMIAIALGGLLAIVLLSIGCFMIRQHRKEDHLMSSSPGLVRSVRV